MAKGNSKLIEKIADICTKKLYPLATIRELLDIYDGISTQTINSDVVKVLGQCGIAVKPYGIGWAITDK